MQQITFKQASNNPATDLAKVTYEGQPEKRRMYRTGYESFLDRLPDIEKSDDKESAKLLAISVMKELGARLLDDSTIVVDAGDKDFARTILAMETPVVNADGELNEGAEFIVANWGKGHTSPVHGHKAGLIYEELLSGKMLVNLYRIIDAEKRIVRTVRSDIYKGNSLLVADYAKGNGGVRDALVHSFTAIEPSTSVHYVPEHTRDGRGNGFSVQHFDDVYPLTGQDVTRITAKDGLFLRKGDVVMVNSTNVPEYGYHYIVITGHNIVKEHGLRPQDIAIAAPTNKLLSKYEQQQGLTLLKLNADAAKLFRNFHGISIENGEVIFPNA